MLRETERGRRRLGQGRPGQCIQAQVDQEGRRSSRVAGRLAQGHNPRHPRRRPEQQESVRQQASRRLEEAQVGHRHKGHQLCCVQGSQVRKGDAC